MKSAYIITNRELVEILGAHLQEQGFDVSNLTIRCTSTNVVVAGISEVREVVEEDDVDSHIQDNITNAVRGHIKGGKVFSVDSLATEMGVPLFAVTTALETLGFDVDEINENAKICDAILGAIADGPRSVQGICNLFEGVSGYDASGYRVRSALDQLGDSVGKVCAVREDGKTVSAWMKTETVKFHEFVKAETARIDARVNDLFVEVLKVAPKFYERYADRMEILNKMVVLCAHGDQAEAIRADCRAVFYRMAERGILEHKGHGWRAGWTAADRINVASLQGAIREVLMQSDFGLSRDDIAKKLPGVVADGLIRCAAKRMDDVYEQHGLLCRDSDN